MADAWLFVSHLDVDGQRVLARKWRGFPLIQARGDCARDWHSRLPGTPFVFGGCDNEYDGTVCFDSLEGAFHASRSATLAELVERLRSKHPNWTDAKIRRSAMEQHLQSPSRHVRHAVI